MKHILLLTDFSDCSINAAHYAVQLYAKERCVFYVLNVQDATAFTMDNLITGSSTDTIYERLVKSHKIQLKTLVEQLKDHADNTNFVFEAIVDHDVFLDAVHQTLASKQIDLIVMGTNGASNLKEKVFGSHTITVMRNVECDLLVIPENYNYKTIKDVVLPMDVNDNMQALTAFVPSLNIIKNSNWNFIRIIQPNEQFDDLGKDIASVNELNNQAHTYQAIQEVPFGYAVKTYLDMNTPDMMIAVYKSEHFLDYLFKASSTTKLSKKLTLPLYITHF